MGSRTKLVVSPTGSVFSAPASQAGSMASEEFTRPSAVFKQRKASEIIRDLAKSTQAKKEGRPGDVIKEVETGSVTIVEEPESQPEEEVGAKKQSPTEAAAESTGSPRQTETALPEPTPGPSATSQDTTATTAESTKTTSSERFEQMLRLIGHKPSDTKPNIDVIQTKGGKIKVQADGANVECAEITVRRNSNTAFLLRNTVVPIMQLTIHTAYT